VNNGDGGSSPDSDSSDSEQAAKVREVTNAEGCSIRRGVNASLRAVFPTDPYVFGPSGSVSQRYGSGSGPFIIVQK
jgi:hypothetical protein